MSQLFDRQLQIPDRRDYDCLKFQFNTRIFIKMGFYQPQILHLQTNIF